MQLPPPASNGTGGGDRVAHRRGRDWGFELGGRRKAEACLETDALALPHLWVQFSPN